MPIDSPVTIQFELEPRHLSTRWRFNRAPPAASYTNTKTVDTTITKEMSGNGGHCKIPEVMLMLKDSPVTVQLEPEPRHLSYSMEVQ